MATIRSYTTMEQSRNLAKILPIESADMWWDTSEDKPRLEKHYHEYLSRTIDPIPAWSLSALMNLFDDKAGLAKDYGLWFCYDNGKSHCTKHYDEPIDAAFEMVCWLKENGKI
jgi:hypothetical protein